MADINQFKFFKKLTLIFLLVVGFWFFAVPALAAPLDFGLQSLNATGLGHADIRIIIANIIKVALGLLGIVAVSLMLYAGYEWMTAGGNEEQIGTAKKILVNATIGLVIMLSAYSIVSFVMTKLVEATTGSGGGGGVCTTAGYVDKGCGCQPPDEYCGPNDPLFIKVKPAGGDVCIKNYYPIIVFSKAVNLDTVDNGDTVKNIIVYNISSTLPAPGHWNYQDSEHKEIYFQPDGDCGVSGKTDCFFASTSYRIMFSHSDYIYSSDGHQLQCTSIPLGSSWLDCSSVPFVTGVNYDDDIPVVTISSPHDGDSLSNNTNVGVVVNFHDNGGLQNIDLNIDGFTHDTVEASPDNHCQTDGSKTINWPTSGYALGTHKITAVGVDYSNKRGEGSVGINLIPGHCFDGILQTQYGEIVSSTPPALDCGGECGACAGSVCSANTDCTSGYCDLATHTCVNKMRISGIDPLNGAVGDYVSVFGQFFGTTTGHVYFKGSDSYTIPATSTCQFDSNQACVSSDQCAGAKLLDDGTGKTFVVTSSKSGICVGTVVSPTFYGYRDSSGSVLSCDLTDTLCHDQWNSSEEVNTWLKSLPGFTGSATLYCKLLSEIATTTAQCIPHTTTITPPSWVEAPIVNCNAGFNNWSDSQIIVSVPAGTATTGPIMVETASTTGPDGVERKFTDLTNDGWGTNLPDFLVTTTSHPGICGLTPDNGNAGDLVLVQGKGFGKLTDYNSSIDNVKFGNKKSALQSSVSWGDNTISTLVPSGLINGFYSVQVTKNNITSNGYKFNLSGQDSTLPIITALSTSTVAKKDYLVIAGKNFGAQKGYVFFKSNSNDTGIVGDTDFPQVCSKNLWSDTQILIKVPSSVSLSKYTIQIERKSDSVFSGWDPNYSVTVVAGNPSPGICDISPSSGAVPFSTAQTMVITGDGFTTGYSPNGNVWFWQNNALPFAINGRLMATDTIFWTANSITLRPPAGTQSGPVIFQSDKMSNSKNFTVFDCTQHNNICADTTQQCCAEGTQIGQCISSGQVCKGLKRSSGYMWLFSTGAIPEIPHVVEQCGNTAQIPSPSPSIKWNAPNGIEDANNTCLTSVVKVQFSTALSNSISHDTAKLFDCGSDSTCATPTEIPYPSMQIDMALVNSPLLSLNLSGNVRWDANKWYQVRLSKNITSTPKLDSSGQPTKFYNLASDAPCGTYPTGFDSAYCFKFHTGSEDCKIKSALITPINYWTNELNKLIDYNGNALSTQYCIMMNPSSFSWQWNVASTTYASVNGASTTTNIKVKTKANTVGVVGLANDSVNINATAVDTTNSINYPATPSPLKIDLSDPQIVDYWPKCLEACTNADVGVRFNIKMSERNLVNLASFENVVKLWKCGDENCSVANRQLVNSDGSYQYADNNTVLYTYNFGKNNAGLEKNQLYQVEISSASDANSQIWSLDYMSSTFDLVDPTNFSKPYAQLFTWRFRTKKEACAVDHVVVSPDVYTAQKLDDHAVFSAVPFSSPDACSATGQSLNPWSNTWSWSSSDPLVASVITNIITSKNPNCTDNCLLKGSEIPFVSSTPVVPLCGNGKIEAGEDCDIALSPTTCTLNCLLKNKINIGSSAIPGSTTTTASICGNGMVGINEDCDLGIPASPTSPTSSMLCSSNCLHMGTKLAAAWCKNSANIIAAGFSPTSTVIANVCKNAISQCGDGFTSGDEDPGCETGVFGVINSNICNEHCVKKVNAKCALADTPGCTADGQLEGSSLLYPVPSVCGDGFDGAGEESACEDSANTVSIGSNFISPWALVVGQGGTVAPTGNPPVQTANITAQTVSKSGFGIYQVQCGYHSDEECVGKYGSGYGLADNTCCYPRAVLSSTYPDTTAVNVCPNTYLEADFDKVIDPNTLPGNLIIAKNDGSTVCANGTEEVSSTLISALENNQSLAWYQKIWHKLLSVVKNLFGVKSASADVWCSGADLGSSEVIPLYDASSNIIGSKIVLNLIQPLATTATGIGAPNYIVILKPGIKDINGVHIAEKTPGKPRNFTFTTGSDICKLSTVGINPDHYYFPAPNTSTVLEATAFTSNDSQIQSIAGFYSWNFVWGPMTNPYVQLTSTTASTNLITSQNLNGEIDVSASANIVDNKYPDKNGITQSGIVDTGRSHIIVFLCENPWPPRQQFPYRDIVGNNDNFNFNSNIFDNTPIPAASVGDGYFNFASYYCADNGASGNTADDLPYMVPAVQTNINILGSGESTTTMVDVYTPVSSTCGGGINKGNACSSSTDCPQATSTCNNGIGNVCKNDQDCNSVLISGIDGVTSYTFASSSLSASVKGMCGTRFYIDNNADLETDFVYPGSPPSLDSVINCTGYGDAFCSAFSPFSASGSGYGLWHQNILSDPTYLNGPSNKAALCLPVSVDTTSKCQPLYSTCDAKPDIKTTKAVDVPVIAGLKSYKRFILTNTKNNDAIGIQVLPNPKHLAAKDWFALMPQYGGKGFVGADSLQTKPLDGYDAVTDGNNYYVNALNYVPLSSATPHNGNLYTNTYLFSINSDASSDTRKVFDQLIQNLRFNYNLSNFGFCGNDVYHTTYDQPCLSDFDCQNGQVCADQKDKLQRNFKRLQDMQTIDNLLNTYQSSHDHTYPALKSGTYLSGQTVSTWPSWTILSNDLVGLPSDPINKLGSAGTCKATPIRYCVDNSSCPSGDTCLLHTPETGWSTADMRFSFACSTSSLAYRYIASSTTSTVGVANYYTVKMNGENDGLQIANLSDLINAFVPPSTYYKFDIQNNFGICNSSEEISTLNKGTCGDGVVNLSQGEQCDPPGSKQYNLTDCTGVGINSSSPMGVKVCTKCMWTSAPNTTCGAAKLSTCGNGIIEVGETCDEGVLNGKYGHCGLGCTYASGSICGDGTVDQQNEVCDTKYDQQNGICDGGLGGAFTGRPCYTDSGCNGFSNPLSGFLEKSTNGKCITLDINKNKYGGYGSSAKKDSCLASCQNFGPYCGDGIVQKEFGEECESNSTCSLGGQSGKVLCGTDCRVHNTAAILDYKFDDVIVSSGKISNSFPSYILNSAVTSSKYIYLTDNSSAYCLGDGSQDCPTTTTSAIGPLKQAMQFNGTSNFFEVSPDKKFGVNQFTISAWVKIDPAQTYDYGVLPILVKADIHSNMVTDYDYQFGVYQENGKPENLVFNSPYIGFFSAVVDNNSKPVNKQIFNNDWHHVAVTVDGDHKVKFYLDGAQLGGEFVGDKILSIAYSTYPLFIGKTTNPIYFKGAMDEVQLYDHALLPAEINNLGQKDTANIFCQIPLAPTSTSGSTVVAPPDCGNGIIQPDLGEVCDASTTSSGLNKNGIPCTSAGYNKSCTYCSADCKNVITVSPTGYCGDGIINGQEKCEKVNVSLYSSNVIPGTLNNGSGLSTDDSTNTLKNGFYVYTCNSELNTTLNASSSDQYKILMSQEALQPGYVNAHWQDTLVTKIGTKSCEDSCGIGVPGYGVKDNCVSCGLSGGGVPVSGQMINVLDPNSNNPLLADTASFKQGDMKLWYMPPVDHGNMQNVAVFAYASNVDGSSYTLSPTYADVANKVAATINSDPMCSDKPNGSYYSLSLNADTSAEHLIDFPVVSNPSKDLFNLLLSPVIPKQAFSNGKSIADGRLSDMRIVVSWSGGDPAAFVSGFYVPASTNPYVFGTGATISTGTNYFSTSSYDGIWYHGLGSRNNLNEEAFTVDTSAMTSTQPLTIAAYAFFVKDNLTGGRMQDDGSNSNLKVDIYLPESQHNGENNDVYRHFAKPSYTFYFSGPLSHTSPSDVKDAGYWHVFDFVSGFAAVSPTIDNNIITSSFNYTSGVTSTFDSVRSYIQLVY